jgi:hypothetical protein
MSRVAIIGSCITRDLWPVRGDALGNVLYVSRTSFPSLLAPPLKGLRPAATPPARLGPHQHRALIADIDKTALASLVAFRPSHLIFDFIDERFDLLSVGAALVTHSWELEVSGYLKQAPFRKARRIPRLGVGCERLWTEAAGELAALVAATPLRQARVILHSARWAETARAGNGRISPIGLIEALPGRPLSIADHNALLARYEARLLQLFPGAAVVESPGLRIADRTHKWGLSPFHYIPDYYGDIREQLAAHGVSTLSRRPAEPSAPAA